MLFHDSDVAINAAIAEWSPGHARSASEADAIEGLLPRLVLEPDDARMLAAMLRWADRERLALAPRGGGTKLCWGSPLTRLDAVLSTARLTSPLDHCAGDLTGTLPAGLTLAAANAALAAERQWLPVDPMHAARTTIGGLVAVGDSGPRRHHYGTPRDLIIGVEMALPDGRLAKAGGRVVKNVAGYDLARLLCGSYGTLAVITAATFKLAPCPPASRTLVAHLPGVEQLGDLAPALAAAALTPSALELDVTANASPRLLVRFETTSSSAGRQAEVAGSVCQRRGASSELLQDAEEAALWREYHDAFSGTALLKLCVLPSCVVHAVKQVGAIAGRHAVGWRLGGRAALGVLIVSLSGSENQLGATVDELREAIVALRGTAVVVAASPALKARVDPWGPIGDALPVMRAMKSRFDPNGTLNPGRGPEGA